MERSCEGNRSVHHDCTGPDELESRVISLWTDECAERTPRGQLRVCGKRFRFSLDSSGPGESRSVGADRTAEAHVAGNLRSSYGCGEAYGRGLYRRLDDVGCLPAG